jgi:pimeloyl-ACP methyl ester carboxylesterase
MSRLHRLTRRETVVGITGLGMAAGLSLGGSEAWAKEGKRRWLTLPPTPVLSNATQSGVAAINGVDIFYAVFGQGPPVLLLHGGLANSNYWGHQVEHLARNFSVVVMDTRGHGRSPLSSHAFSYAAFAEDAGALLDFLKTSQAAVVGWSDGAVTGLQLAMTRPHRITKLFAFGGNSSLDGLKAGGARSLVFADYARRCHAEYAQLSPHPERWPQLLDGLRVMWRTEPNFTRRSLAAIKAPTTISDGEHDEIIKRDHTESMARAIANARLVILPDVSHFAMLQDPGQFNQALTAFLAA